MFPAEYQRATDDFYDFLQTVRGIALFTDSHPPYTITQAVFQVFRRRLSLSESIRFAQVLPVGLRALFVADWDPDEPRRAFGSRDEMTRELCELRPEHNYSGDTSISDVAKALRLHVDEAAFDAVLATLPPGAREFWSTLDPAVEPLRIAGFTRVPYIEMTARVRDAISSSGGFILDSHMFSNALLSISFEVRGRDVELLATAISQAGLRFDSQSTSRLADWDASAIGPDLVIPGALSINFLHDDPPLRIEVPAVPG